MITDAKKASNAAWDRENMVYQTIKVRKEILEAFRAAVAANGDKVNTVLREAMEDYTARGNVRHVPDVATGDGLLLDAETTGQAERAAEATGEAVTDWIRRAIRETAETDKRRIELAADLQKRKAAQEAPAEKTDELQRGPFDYTGQCKAIFDKWNEHKQTE